MFEFPVLIVSTFISALFTIIITSASQTIAIRKYQNTKPADRMKNALKMCSQIVITFSFSILSSLVLSNFIISN